FHFDLLLPHTTTTACRNVTLFHFYQSGRHHPSVEIRSPSNRLFCSYSPSHYFPHLLFYRQEVHVPLHIPSATTSGHQAQTHRQNLGWDWRNHSHTYPHYLV